MPLNIMRNPIASDRLYPGNPMELYEMINKYFVKLNKKDVKIAIVPHSGYIYSGKCLGRVYSHFDLEKIKDVETVILLGPNHTKIGNKISFSEQSFLTPFGKVEVDLDLIKQIKNSALEINLSVEENEEAHNKEHSLEVQLPFMQQVFNKNLKIVPIIFKSMDYEECVFFAKVLFDCISNSGKKVLVIVSSDFTHHGKSYNFEKFKENFREKLYDVDKKSVDFILDFNSKGFYDYAVSETTICGVFSITIAIELSKLFDLKNSENVSYYNSGDITGDYENSVNYAGVVFW